MATVVCLPRAAAGAEPADPQGGLGPVGEVVNAAADLLSTTGDGLQMDPNVMQGKATKLRNAADRHISRATASTPGGLPSPGILFDPARNGAASGTSVIDLDAMRKRESAAKGAPAATAASPAPTAPNGPIRQPGTEPARFAPTPFPAPAERDAIPWPMKPTEYGHTQTNAAKPSAASPTAAPREARPPMQPPKNLDLQGLDLNDIARKAGLGDRIPPGIDLNKFAEQQGMIKPGSYIRKPGDPEPPTEAAVQAVKAGMPEFNGQTNAAPGADARP